MFFGFSFLSQDRAYGALEHTQSYQDARRLFIFSHCHDSCSHFFSPHASAFTSPMARV
jgi:hypothetical protein